MAQANCRQSHQSYPQGLLTEAWLLPIFLLLLLFCSANSTIDTKCPNQCICVPKGMSCEKSGLKKLPSPHSPQLEYLLIENQTLDSSHLGQTELSMYTSREYGGSVQLKNLYLRRCNIESIGRYAFQSLGPQLEMIDLTGNPLRHIGDYAFAGLEQLTLVLDEIEQPEFARHTFVGLIKLKSLTMQNAKLTKLPYEPLQQLTSEGKLDKLMLRGNQVQSLDTKYDEIFRKLQTFDIRDNPWHCDCQINWLIRRYSTLVAGRNSIKGSRHQPDTVHGPVSAPWELEGRQPRCASPAAVVGRNFTSLITNIDQIYGRPSATSGEIVPTVLYCSPPRLTQLTVDLSEFLSSGQKKETIVSSQNEDKSNENKDGTQNVKLRCTVKGSRQLLLRWLYHDKHSGLRVVGNQIRPKLPPTDEAVSKTQLPLITDDQYISENDLNIFKINQDVDTYSCLAQDVIGNISTSVRIKWPPISPILSLPDKQLDVDVPPNPTRNNKNASGVYLNNWKIAEPGLVGGYAALHTPQFSLSDLLWAVFGTFFSTLLLFFIIYTVMHSSPSSCAKQKCYQLESRTSDSLAIVPGDSSLSNSSPSNIKLVSGQQTTLSDLTPGNSVQYNNHSGMMPVACSLLQGHTYHLLNGAPVFTHQTLPSGTLNSRSIPHEGISPGKLITPPVRSIIPPDGSISSTSAYEPVVYADANCAHKSLVNYDVPGLNSGLANMRLYNEQQIPLLLNNYVLDLNRSVTGRPAEFIPSVMRIPPPPATPQPSLPGSINSLHPVNGLDLRTQSQAAPTSSSQLSSNLLMMQAGYPSIQHDSAFSETVSG